MSQLSDKIGGFATIPNTVVKMIPEIGVEAFTLWSYLRYRTNGESGLAFPSYETIKADTGMHYRKVAKALRALEDKKLLTRHKRFGNSTEYTLICPVLPPLEGNSSQRVQTNKTDGTKKENKKAEPPKVNAYASYNSAFGEPIFNPTSPRTINAVEDLEEYPQDWLDEAFLRTSKRERSAGERWKEYQRFPYALSLLNEWKRAGAILPEQTQKPKPTYSRGPSRPPAPGYTPPTEAERAAFHARLANAP